MVFNPEDEQNIGPHCRNCHKGSSRCSTCHNTSGAYTSALAGETAYNQSAENWRSFSSTPTNQSTYHMSKTSQNVTNPLGSSTSLVVASKYNVPGASNQTILLEGFFKKSRTADWASDWRTTSTSVAMGKRLTSAGIAASCSDDGFSWPHRTLGWKMLKDDLFGLDFDGIKWVVPGDTRTIPGGGGEVVAHDLDSVCLDCHNPNVWGATNTGAGGRIDTPGLSSDDFNDELLTRGLP